VTVAASSGADAESFCSAELQNHSGHVLASWIREQ